MWDTGTSNFARCSWRPRSRCLLRGTAALVMLLCSLYVAPASAEIEDFTRQYHKPEEQQHKEQERRGLDEFVPLGVQSGPDIGHSVASAVRVHNGQSAWIVGSTQGNWFQPNTPSSSDVSGCFLAEVGFATDLNSSGEWGTRITLDNPDSDEDCNNLSFLSTSRVVLSGHAEPGGILSGLYNAGAYTVVDHFGTLLDLNLGSSSLSSSSNVDSSAPSLYGGYLMAQMTANYPMSTVVDSNSPPNLYVLSMGTNKVTPADTDTEVIPIDWITINDPREFFLTRMSFAMVVSKFTPVDPSTLTPDDTDFEKSLTSSWRHPFSTTDGRTVHTAGIDKIRVGSTEVLVVAGTTAGHGSAFGSEPNYLSGDLDGYVTRLSMLTGQLESTPLSRRVQSVSGADDWIGGICTHGNDIYVAGSTRGDMKENPAEPNDGVDAFLMKLNGTTLESIWVYQLGARPREADGDPATATGVACVVTPDGKSVYLAGNVESGAVLEMAGTVSSYGDDDVYVAQLDAATGKVNYVRQIGSDDRDVVAFRHGLSVDQDGNAVLAGSTFGSFYRKRDPSQESTSDVFAMTVSKYNGALAASLSRQEFIGTGEIDSSGSGVPDTSSPEPSAEEKAGIGVGIFFVFFLGGMLVIYCCCCYARRKHSSAAAETDRSKVLRYLSSFDVEDVDLKHSATGGWHCSYAGPLANGIVTGSSHARYRDDPCDGGDSSDHPESPDVLEGSLYAEEEPERMPAPASNEKSQGNRRSNGYYRSSLLDHGRDDERVGGVVDDGDPSLRRGGWGRDII